MNIIDPDADVLLTKAATLHNPAGRAPVLVICEHASDFIPVEYADLGLKAKDRQSHVVWDPGAMAVAKHLSKHLDAKLVASNVSRLLYDCNRPPNAAGAIPKRSEIFTIAGNANLTEHEKAQRVARFYEPFRALLANTLAQDKNLQVLVTIHSFTPIYMGKPRAVEFGILHDSDSRLADAMLANVAKYPNLNVERNAPYGPQDGVTHTLKLHGIKNGLANVMLEIRNDLLISTAQQVEMANVVVGLLMPALKSLGVSTEIAPPRG